MIVSLFFGLKEIENFRQDNMRDVEQSQEIKKILNIEDDKKVLLSVKNELVKVFQDEKGSVNGL